jgi:16S rRNA (cytidine1402-2'-O)-methyltransferase
MGHSADSFVFLGFPPTRSKDRNAWLDRLANASSVVVLFEAPHRIQATLADIKAIAGDVEVLVTRELTKLHEQSVRGHISEIASQLDDARGEYTVVLDMAERPQLLGAERPDSEVIVSEFGEMTKHESSTRRDAVANLARRHKLSVNQVYSLIEAAKKSVG